MEEQDLLPSIKTQMKMPRNQLTEKRYNDLVDKTYTSGREMEIGDTVIWGMCRGKEDDKTIELDLVKFHLDELGVIYKISEIQENQTLPFLEKI